MISPNKGGEIDKGYACPITGVQEVSIQKKCRGSSPLFLYGADCRSKWPIALYNNHTYKEHRNLEKKMKEGDRSCGGEYAIPMDMKRRGLPTTLVTLFKDEASDHMLLSRRLWAKRLSHDVSDTSNFVLPNPRSVIIQAREGC